MMCFMLISKQIISNCFFEFYFRFSSEFDTPAIENALDSSILSTTNSTKSLNRSTSNPDLSTLSISSSNGAIQDEDLATFVVKVYRSDQTHKYFPVLKDTTAQQVVQLAIKEFNINDQTRYLLRTMKITEILLD